MPYIIWLFISAVIPLFLIWLKYLNLLWKYKQTLVFVILLALLVHIPWDIFAVQNSIWSFPLEKNLGVVIASVPLEEYLYMIFVPLLGACISLVAKYKFRQKKG